MSSQLMGFAIEGLVAVLLTVTIFYCVILNARLKRLRSDESQLRATIGELVTATEIAERAINGLKHAATECDKTLAKRVREAEFFSMEIAREIGEGEKVLERISKIAIAARAPTPLVSAPETQVVSVAATPKSSTAAELRARALEAAERLTNLRRSVEGKAA
jgi:hypothetical protein